jgi:hypothetical protein
LDTVTMGDLSSFQKCIQNFLHRYFALGISFFDRKIQSTRTFHLLLGVVYHVDVFLI